MVEELLYFSSFSGFVPFLQVFGQVKEKRLHEMIKKLRHEVACPMGFDLLCDRGQQGGVFKPTKNDHFQIFLAVWVLFPKFFGRLRGEL